MEITHNNQINIDVLDQLVTWMRKRGVSAVKHGELAITLATMTEPAPHHSAMKPDMDEVRKRAREEKMMMYYGSVPTRDEDGSETHGR